MVDVYSRGRLECGFVRGVPYEMSAGNHRPTRMMERFWEAHDLIVKAWTSHDGPFNWEGKYFQHRQVNIWPRPYQEPHPPIWITALSPSSARGVGENGYVVACFLTGFEGTKAVFTNYLPERSIPGSKSSSAPRSLLSRSARPRGDLQPPSRALADVRVVARRALAVVPVLCGWCLLDVHRR